MWKICAKYLPYIYVDFYLFILCFISYIIIFRLLFIHVTMRANTPNTHMRHTHTHAHDTPHSRSIADGQSQHSFSNNSHRGYLGSAFPTNLVNSRPELRQSRQSLAAASERMSRASYAGSIHGGGGGGVGPGMVGPVGMGGGLGGAGSLMGMSGLVGPGGPASIASSNARRSRPRSRSRDQLNTTHIHNHRPGSR